MKMKALDSFYSDDTKLVHRGDDFEVSDSHAAELEKSGLAKSAGKSSSGPSDNKMARPAANKADKPVEEDKMARAGVVTSKSVTKRKG